MIKKIIGGIVVLIIIIAIGLPKFFSSQNENYLNNFIQGISAYTHNDVTGKVVSNDPSWFSSKSTVELNFKHKNPLTGAITSTPVEYTLNNHFGPFIIYKKEGKTKFYIGRMVSNVKLDKVGANPYDIKTGANHGILYLSLLGDFHIKGANDNSIAMQYKALSANVLTGPISWTLTNNLKNLSGDVNFHKVNING